MKKVKKARGSILAAALLLAIVFSVSASAERSWLDVSAGDRYSYYTYKDTNDYENLYYVTPDIYVGFPIIARSVSQSGQYSSAYTQMENKRAWYSYGTTNVPGGINYRLEAGPSYLSGANWHLTGYYTP